MAILNMGCKMRIIDVELAIVDDLKRSPEAAYAHKLTQICGMIADAYRPFLQPDEGVAIDEAWARLQMLAGDVTVESEGLHPTGDELVERLAEKASSSEGPVGVNHALTVFRDAVYEMSDRVSRQWITLDWIVRPFIFHPTRGMNIQGAHAFRYDTLELDPSSELAADLDTLRNIASE